MNAIIYTADLGIVMQLTKILRNARGNLSKERISVQGKTSLVSTIGQDLFDRAFNIKVADMLKSRSSRLPVYLTRFKNSFIVNRTERDRYDVFEQRTCLNASEELTAVPRVLFQMRSQYRELRKGQAYKTLFYN